MGLGGKGNNSFFMLFFCTILMFDVLFPACAYADNDKAPLKLNNLLVFGDSLSDNNGSFSTWKLLNTLKGNSVEGSSMNMLPFLHNALMQDVPGYAVLVQIHWVKHQLQRVEKEALAAFLGLTKNLPIPLLPDPKYYLPGIFSGGDQYRGIWPDYLQTMLGATFLDNRAMAGSWTLCAPQKVQYFGNLVNISEGVKNLAVNFMSGSLVPPCEGLIISAWSQSSPPLDLANTLVVFFNSANDYINSWPDPNAVANKHIADITRLLRGGARYIAVFSVPDISATPRYQSTAKNLRESTATAIREHNSALKLGLEQVRQRYSDAVIIELDSVSMVNQMITGAKQQGIETESPCLNLTVGNPAFDPLHATGLNGLPRPIRQNPAVADEVSLRELLHQGDDVSKCENPDNYFYFDALHPTAHAHYEIARHVCHQLQQYGIDCSPDITQPDTKLSNRMPFWL